MDFCPVGKKRSTNWIRLMLLSLTATSQLDCCLVIANHDNLYQHHDVVSNWDNIIYTIVATLKLLSWHKHSLCLSLLQVERYDTTKEKLYQFSAMLTQAGTPPRESLLMSTGYAMLIHLGLLLLLPGPIVIELCPEQKGL